MFEKEAGEYAIVRLPDGYTKIVHQKRIDYQKGAEFGYNKAREELLEQAKNYIAETASGTAEEMGDRVQFYIAGLLDGYAKGKAEMQGKLKTPF